MLNKKVVIIGGGTGTSAILPHLAKAYRSVSAIVNMVDEGGSTGLLRKELSIPPVGDIRQIISNIAREPMRDVLEYRFTSGIFKGHPVGNILLAGLFKSGHSHALSKVAEILSEGKNITIIPSTYNTIRLVGSNGKSRIIGESNIYKNKSVTEKTHFSIDSKCQPNKQALEAIQGADEIIVAPGDFFCSILPTLLTPRLAKEIQMSSAKKVFICNAKNDYPGLGTEVTLQTFLDILGRHKIHINFDWYFINQPEHVGKDSIGPSSLNQEKQIIKKFLRNTKKASFKHDLVANRNLLMHDGKIVVKTVIELQ